MNWIAAQAELPYDMREVALAFGVTLTSVEQFLRQKVVLPAV